MEEAFGKALEFLAKFSWAVCITIAFVLFMPEEPAKQLGLQVLRDPYKGYLWIALVLSLLITVGGLFKYVDRKIDGWLNGRREEEKRVREAAQFDESMSLRLDGLDENERNWLRYCLMHRVQSLSAELTNKTAQSLCAKRFIVQGSGAMYDLPFHFPDKVWRFLLKNEEALLPPEARVDGEVRASLERWRLRLWGGDRI